MSSNYTHKYTHQRTCVKSHARYVKQKRNFNQTGRASTRTGTLTRGVVPARDDAATEDDSDDTTTDHTWESPTPNPRVGSTHRR
jgi:hypothetical protein